MAAVTSNNRLQTLDEPVAETLKRDLRAIGIKLKYVLLPRMTEEDTIRELRNWVRVSYIAGTSRLIFAPPITGPVGPFAAVLGIEHLVVHHGACAPGLVCVCDHLCDCMGRRGSGHAQRSAARWHRVILSKRVRARILHLPNCHCVGAVPMGQSRVESHCDVHFLRLVYTRIGCFHVSARQPLAQGSCRLPRVFVLFRFMLVGVLGVVEACSLV